MTPAALQMLEKVFSAAFALLLQRLLMLFSILVELPQTALRLTGSGCVLFICWSVKLHTKVRMTYLTAAKRHAGGVASTNRAAMAKRNSKMVDLANMAASWV